MSDIFREEALEELRSRGGPGDVLRTRPRWLMWSFALLLVLAALGVATALTFRVSEEAHGTASVENDGRSVRAVLPLALRGEVRPGAVIRLNFDNAHRTARVTSVQATPGGLVARTRLISPLPEQIPRTGHASIQVGSKTLFDLLRG